MALATAPEITPKHSGRVLTPEPLAQALCEWAVRSPVDDVLDLGVGEGAFAIVAVEALRRLGAEPRAAAAQIHGAEWDPWTFAQAQEIARRRLGTPLPNVVCADFYDTPLPSVDAMVGNPPYIRRHYQLEPAKYRSAPEVQGSSGLTDAYCLFLLRACAALKQGGRLAVLVSASWLDMRYGQELKRLLLEQFGIHLLLSFEGRVFSDALVKPVVLLAEKGAPAAQVTFARYAEMDSLAALPAAIGALAMGASRPAAVARVEQSALRPERPWSPYFRAPDVYAELLKEAPLTALGQVAESRIGLQTFAKSFFVLTRNEAEAAGLEDEFLLPLAFSPRSVRVPVIGDAALTPHVLFACDRDLRTIPGTSARRYILAAMETPVAVRGKDEVVMGVHQAPRLRRARRRPWYNVRTAVERRGAWPLLLPRRIFTNYVVVHNLAGVVANEDFIELKPRAGATAAAPLLAFLNSAVGEILVRSHAFQYGGGVFNLNPGSVPEIPVVDLANILPNGRAQLARAWEQFVIQSGQPDARDHLNAAVERVLGLSAVLRERLHEGHALLVDLAPAANRLHQHLAAHST